jgi:hypothetical protein
MPHSTEISRRTLLGAAAAGMLQAASPTPGLKLSIFSKHLQFLQGEALAKATADIGLDGIDLAVRKGGHIEPEVAPVELPKLVKIVRDHGLEVPMITTDIVDVNSPNAESLLKTMQSLGIRNYRWGGFKYDYSKPMAPQLEALKPRVAKLAELNKRYEATAMYHTHSGTAVVGASIWDLHIILKDFDPAAVGVNYDVGHAMIEGGFGGWINSFYITGKYVRGIAIKDCIWQKGANGAWKSAFVPMGEGMVHFPEFFKMVKASGFNGPLQIHYEYPLGGAQNGKTELTMPQAEIFAAMKRDVVKVRSYLKDANL